MAADVTNQPSDPGWALPLVKQIEDNTGSLPKERHPPTPATTRLKR